jgi:mono/diheme cytochrome c family protein
VRHLTPEEWAALDPRGAITSVTISGSPVVRFSLTNSKGRGLKGLGAFTARASTASLTSYPNLSFALAKLVPEDVSAGSKAPSKWVSYIVTSTPNVAAPAVVPGRPSTDNTGTLVDNGDGTYQYTFNRDITKTKAILDAHKYDATKNEIKADLGDTTYDPTLAHRLTIQFAGNARGTGTNTADGVTVATAVAMKKPINLIYDFVPATGKPVSSANTQREVVSVQNCNECHTKFSSFHGGSRVEAQYCVVCHTDQRKYGRAEATTTATGYSGTRYRIGGLAVGRRLPQHRVAPVRFQGDHAIAGHRLLRQLQDGALLIQHGAAERQPRDGGSRAGNGHSRFQPLLSDRWDGEDIGDVHSGTPRQDNIADNAHPVSLELLVGRRPVCIAGQWVAYHGAGTRVLVRGVVNIDRDLVGLARLQGGGKVGFERRELPVVLGHPSAVAVHRGVVPDFLQLQNESAAGLAPLARNRELLPVPDRYRWRVGGQGHGRYAARFASAGRDPLIAGIEHRFPDAVQANLGSQQTCGAGRLGGGRQTSRPGDQRENHQPPWERARVTARQEAGSRHSILLSGGAFETLHHSAAERFSSSW